LSYLQTKHGAGIDFVLERPSQSVVLIEVKSKENVTEHLCRHLHHFQKDFQGSQLFLLSNDPIQRLIGSVQAHPWQEGLPRIFEMEQV
jgi:hypothetical protein